MVLFCVAIRRNSPSFLRFSFHGHVQVFSWEISSVCRLKYPYSCFSSHFYFLVFIVLLIRAVSGHCNFFFFFNIVLESLYWHLHIIFNASVSSSFFFSWHIYSVSSLGYKTLSSGLPLSILRIIQNILPGVLPKRLSISWDFRCWVWYRQVFAFVFSYFSFTSA